MTEDLVVTITVDTSRLTRAFREVDRAMYRRFVRWAWQRSDPNPVPYIRLWGRSQ